jgi:hypothetical protein
LKRSSTLRIPVTPCPANSHTRNYVALAGFAPEPPEPEVAATLSEGRDNSKLNALRNLVTSAVEHAEEGVSLPPKIHGALPSLRR